MIGIYKGSIKHLVGEKALIVKYENKTVGVQFNSINLTWDKKLDCGPEFTIENGEKLRKIIREERISVLHLLAFGTHDFWASDFEIEKPVVRLGDRVSIKAINGKYQTEGTVVHIFLAHVIPDLQLIMRYYKSDKLYRVLGIDRYVIDNGNEQYAVIPDNGQFEWTVFGNTITEWWRKASVAEKRNFMVEIGAPKVTDNVYYVDVL